MAAKQEALPHKFVAPPTLSKEDVDAQDMALRPWPPLHRLAACATLGC